MNVKSLLCAAAMLGVCGISQASIPDYTIYPAEGTLDSNQYFSVFNLTFSGVNEVEIVDNMGATLMDADGYDVICTNMFVDQSNPGSLGISFNEGEITTNGLWTFTLSAGAITVNGEANPAIVAQYTLDDPNLGLGEFPQIQLVSIDPAADSKWPVWGGSYFDKVKIETSDDDAVNYIEWFLYDVTNGEDPGVAEYLLQGNDNRYDFNRYHHHDDIWSDGLYISVASNEKLIEGHKYRLDLRFCGIGYNDETNQYPTPQQLEASTELETSVYYYGLTPAPEYSPYEYETVLPDPNSGYVISSMEWAHFLITYSGPVKPVSFDYSLGSGAGIAPAGEWKVADGTELDVDGYANAWEFFFDETVVKEAIGVISVSVQTIDKDGLYVKGNMGTTFDNYRYYMDWECNLGAPALISVEPTDGSEVEVLSSITVANELGLEMAIYDGNSDKPQISDRGRGVVRELDAPKISSDGTQVTWTFEPLTDEGIYTLIIPDKYFVLGEQFMSYLSNAITFTYTVTGGTTPGEVTYDILPGYIEPEDDSELTSFSMLHLVFDDITFTPMNGAPAVKLYNVTGEEEVLMQEINPNDDPEKFIYNDFWEPTVYDIMFDEVTEPGSYKVVLPQGLFCNAAYDESEGTEGNANPEIVLNYVIKEAGLSNVVYDIMPIEISPEADSEIAEISTVTLTFEEVVFPAQVLSGFSVSFVPAELYQLNDTEEVLLQSVDPLDNPASDWLNPTIYDFNFDTVTEKGQYKVVVAEGTFGTETYQDSEFTEGRANPEIVLYYTVGNGSGVDAIVGGAETINVYDMNGVQILNNANVEAAKTLDSGLYIINGKKVVIRR